MSTVTFIVGLLGSGKSTLAQKIELDWGARRFEDFENGSDANANYQALIRSLREGRDCVVVEIAYCIAPNRENIMQRITNDLPDTRITWVCFENNLERANENVRRRSRADVDGELRRNQWLTGEYTYPEGIEPFPVPTAAAPTRDKRSPLQPGPASQ